MSTHTPGPWNLVWWGNETYPYPLSILADKDGAWVTRNGTVSSEANARLIAAAPEMLAALKEALTLGALAFELDDAAAKNVKPLEAEMARIYEAGVAAIAKATGEPS